MTTTISTTCISTPTGQIPSIISKWRNEYESKLQEMQKHILATRQTFPDKHRKTISALRNKETYNVSQNEKYILIVTVLDASLDKVKAYLGCSECEEETDTQAGDVYYCTNCLTDNVTSLPSCTFSMDTNAIKAHGIQLKIDRIVNNAPNLLERLQVFMAPNAVTGLFIHEQLVLQLFQPLAFNNPCFIAPRVCSTTVSCVISLYLNKKFLLFLSVTYQMFNYSISAGCHLYVAIGMVRNKEKELQIYSKSS